MLPFLDGRGRSPAVCQEFHPVSIRLIAGRAGSGKTHWCLSRICHALEESLTDGPRLVMLVPEQAALQMERGLLAMLRQRIGAMALGRCEVLSFRRLAHRILTEASAHSAAGSQSVMPVPLSATGRKMALRHLLGRHRKSLQEFGRVAERSGFIAELSRGITELIQEAVSVEAVEACARDAAATDDPTATRLHDVALLYRAYLDYLGDHRVDPEGVLDLARARLTAATWLRGAQIWIDGFAGLTRQQMRMISALARVAEQVDIALLLDPQRGRTRDADAAPDDLSLFARTERTWSALLRTLIDARVHVDEPVLLGADGCPRFVAAPMLAELERRFFAVPPLVDEPPISESEATQPEPSILLSDPDTGCGIRNSSTPGATGGLSARGDTGSPDAASGPVAPAYQVLPLEIPRPSVRLVTARDRRVEVDAAIREIVDLVQRPERPMRYRDIAIVVRDLTPYHDLISASLRRHDIPFFIDRRRPTHHHPLVQFVRAAAALIGGGRFDEAMTGILKTGLNGLTEEAADAVENYALAYGLISHEAWEQPWTRPVVVGAKETGAEARASDWQRKKTDECDRARRQLLERFGDWWPLPGKTGGAKCQTWAERLFSLLRRFAIDEQLARWCHDAQSRADADEAAEHTQVWNDLVKLLDELVAAMGDVPMGGRQFREVLEAGLSDLTLGLVPATIDQVLVGSIERSRHPPVKAVFLLGFADGSFPARLGEDTIFGDDERAFLEARETRLGRTRAQQLLDERLLAYVAVTRPSEFLWISYPEADEQGREIAPSPYWPALRAALRSDHAKGAVAPERVAAGASAGRGAPIDSADTEGPHAITTVTDLAGALAVNLRAWAAGQTEDASAAPWLALYEWARTSEGPIHVAVKNALRALAPPEDAKLSKAAAAKLWPPPYRTSVTRLETFAACPFKHYAQYGLRLAERAMHEISALELGSLYHAILDQFVSEMIESGTSLRDLSTADIATRLVRLCEHVVPQYAEQLGLAEPQRRSVGRRARRELPISLEGQRDTVGKTPLHPALTEQIFGGGDADALPALELSTKNGNTVIIRGKIDRIDLLPVERDALAVVFDYKRSLGRRLKLDEVYHGLALQLLAYLLVIRDAGLPGVEGKIIPAGAFYLPLLGGYQRVEHPNEASADDFAPFKDYKPRGVVDFDWIDTLDPKLAANWSCIFSVYKKADGSMGHVEKSDAVGRAGLLNLLSHVRRKMSELCDAWIAGDIAVRPARLGRTFPCTYCPYRGVCRYEFVSAQARRLSPISREQVLKLLAEAAGGAHG